jgi:hypothetical protein
MGMINKEQKDDFGVLEHFVGMQPHAHEIGQVMGDWRCVHQQT